MSCSISSKGRHGLQVHNQPWGRKRKQSVRNWPWGLLGTEWGRNWTVIHLWATETDYNTQTTAGGYTSVPRASGHTYSDTHNDICDTRRTQQTKTYNKGTFKNEILISLFRLRTELNNNNKENKKVTNNTRWFPGRGHPSKYYPPGPSLLTFGDRTRTGGAFNVVWPLATALWNVTIM